MHQNMLIKIKSSKIHKNRKKKSRIAQISNTLNIRIFNNKKLYKVTQFKISTTIHVSLMEPKVT